ncbi:PREDICTED: zinc finger protein 595-like [Dinoponera quadriceps]|uniref:Zinc finger protein 595-like n=1 Tax=Dinoponera quadriceps TaxID=609295 RepID=A0A6P3WVD3_DINQU|nr:PREDICTED: zinc finger protein 595-like [Dinoponera quadriceps]
MMTLRLFDCQDYPTLDAIPNMYTENGEMENYDYLRECINNLESKDSGVNVSATSTSTLDIGLQGNSLDDVNLSNIDFNFIKIENLLLQNVEESEICAKNKEVKQEKSADIDIPDSIGNFDTVSLGYNTFSNFSNSNSIKPSNDVSTAINNDESHTFDKDLTAQFNGSETKQTVEFYNCSVKPFTKKDNNDNINSSTDKDSNCTKPVSSELKHGVKVDNLEQSDVDGQVQKCEQCLMTFRYKRHLDRHLEGHKKNNCPHCNGKFARRKHLEVHLFRAHGERIVKHLYLCDVCPRSFPKRVLLNRHRAKHNYQSGKVCSECGDMIKPDTDEKEHEENHCKKKQFKCEQCSQTFSIEQTYLSHIQNHNNHKCPNCDVSFASKKKAHEHFKAVHTPKLSESEATSNDLHYCASCRHRFVKKDDYFRHLESTLHLSKVNRDTPIKAIFSCTICAKKLFTQRALDQHIRRIHKGEKRFACDIYGCTFQCARRTDLDRHKHLHVEERNVVCEHCGKTFTSVSILKDHVLYIHSKERQFICEECGKAFKRNSLLKRHKLSHAQHRPFVCMQCSTAFKRSHHLTRHMEACHRITLEKKKKVMKLMKTEDGNLVPVPENPKRSKSNKIKTKKERKSVEKKKEEDHSIMNPNEQIASVDLQLQSQPSSTNSEENSECPNLSLELTNLSVIDSIPQVLSLVDITTGQMLTVQVTNPELLPSNELADQFETNCNEILNLPDYQDIEFQNSLLNADQTCYDSASYSEVSLENIEDSVPLMNNNCKIEEIERYLIREFSPFYNL